MPTHSTDGGTTRALARASTRGTAAVAMAVAAAILWSLLVAASPARFFAWAAPFCVAWIAFSARAAPPGLADLFRPRAPDVLLGVLTAVVLYAGSRAFLWALCGGVSDALRAPLVAMFDRFRTRALLPGLALFFLVAPAEELFWRGVLQARLAGRLGPGAAVAVTTTLAALLGVATREPLLALATLPTHVAWGALAAWRRSLVPAIVSHALWTTLVATLAPPV